MICQFCGRKIKYLQEYNLCGFDFCLRSGYCSQKCFEQSDDYCEYKRKFLQLYPQLNREGKELVDMLLYELNDDWVSYEIPKWIKELKNGRK